MVGSSFAAQHPGVEIALTVENRDRVVQRLVQGADDLAVMMLPPGDLPLEAMPFLGNPLVVIAPVRHPLAGRTVTLASLAAERWLMRERGSGTRTVAETHFAGVAFLGAPSAGVKAVGKWPRRRGPGAFQVRSPRVQAARAAWAGASGGGGGRFSRAGALDPARTCLRFFFAERCGAAAGVPRTPPHRN